MTKPLHYKSFIPKSSTQLLPVPIMSFRSEATLQLPRAQLMDRCRDLNITVTDTQATNVELETRKQAACKIWFAQRAGRVTASRLKDVLSTNPSNPSKSLVKCICYPEAQKFSTDATRFVQIYTYEIFLIEHEKFSYAVIIIISFI